MDFAPTEQPDGPSRRAAGRAAGRPARVRGGGSARRAAGPTVALADRRRHRRRRDRRGRDRRRRSPRPDRRPSPRPTTANARGVLLGADTGTWNGAERRAAATPNVTGMMGDRDGTEFGPGGMGPAGSDRAGSDRAGWVAAAAWAARGIRLHLDHGDRRNRSSASRPRTAGPGRSTPQAPPSRRAARPSTSRRSRSAIRSSSTRSRQTDGTFKITAIQVVLPHANGTVKSVGDSSVTLTQRDGTDKVVQLTGSTTYQLAGAASKGTASTQGRPHGRRRGRRRGHDGDRWHVHGHARDDPGIARRAAPSPRTTATSITVTTRDSSSLTINGRLPRPPTRWPA